jgi:hypothetical protein
VSPSGTNDNESRDGGRDDRRSNGGNQGRSDRPQRDGERPPYRGNSDRPQQGGERPPYRGNSDRPSTGGYRGNTDRPQGGERPPYRGNSERPQRDGERPPYRGNSDRPSTGGYRGNSERPQQGGERPPYRGNSERPQQGGERPPYRGNSDRPSTGGAERKPWAKDGARPERSDRPQQGGDKPWTQRGGSPNRAGAPRGDAGKTPRGDAGKKLWTREGAPARGDRDARVVEEEMTEEQRMQRELRSVRPRHDDPELPDDITAQDLDRIARNELKTLSKDNAEAVGRHLAMAARVIEADPELAHRHVMSAARRAGRIAVVRESLAITAYATGDFALALRELRTYRRISGSNDQLALMVDSERGVGRPDRALELGRSVERASLPASVQVALAIAMSGARLDLGDAEAALTELEIPQLNPKTAFSYSAELFAAYAEVLGELGRDDDAALWNERAERADAAVSGATEFDETMEILEIDEEESDEEESDEEESDEDATDVSDDEFAGEADDDDAADNSADDSTDDEAEHDAEASPRA